jgi:hypothetical protein
MQHEHKHGMRSKSDARKHQQHSTEHQPKSTKHHASAKHVQASQNHGKSIATNQQVKDISYKPYKSQMPRPCKSTIRRDTKA